MLNVKIVPNGPLVLAGPFTTGGEAKDKGYLCRCGASSNKPWCDGTHRTGPDGGWECSPVAPTHVPFCVLAGPCNRNLAERATARPQKVAAAVPAGGDVALDSIPAATVAPKPRKPKAQKKRR